MIYLDMSQNIEVPKRALRLIPQEHLNDRNFNPASVCMLDNDVILYNHPANDQTLMCVNPVFAGGAARPIWTFGRGGMDLTPSLFDHMTHPMVFRGSLNVRACYLYQDGYMVTVELHGDMHTSTDAKNVQSYGSVFPPLFSHAIGPRGAVFSQRHSSVALITRDAGATWGLRGSQCRGGACFSSARNLRAPAFGVGHVNSRVSSMDTATASMSGMDSNNIIAHLRQRADTSENFMRKVYALVDEIGIDTSTMSQEEVLKFLRTVIHG